VGNFGEAHAKIRRRVEIEREPAQGIAPRGDVGRVDRAGKSEGLACARIQLERTIVESELAKDRRSSVERICSVKQSGCTVEGLHSSIVPATEGLAYIV
jgi:hypothetical protein